MKLMIEMRVENYDNLLGKCDLSSPEFKTLINGCVERRGDKDNFENFMQILCEKEQAKALRNVAIDLFPEAVLAITKALGDAGEQ